jgi:hypothetical protein
VFFTSPSSILCRLENPPFHESSDEPLCSDYSTPPDGPAGALKNGSENWLDDLVAKILPYFIFNLKKSEVGYVSRHGKCVLWLQMAPIEPLLTSPASDASAHTGLLLWLNPNSL